MLGKIRVNNYNQLQEHVIGIRKKITVQQQFTQQINSSNKFTFKGELRSKKSLAVFTKMKIVKF